MKKTLIVTGLISLMALTGNLNAQHDSIAENDPAILHRIGEWQDLKFGFMMHWGIYAQWGVVESWSICNEDWIVRERIGDDGRPVKGTRDGDYYKYKQAYQALNRTFNPQHFAPVEWAAAARQAGMKYVVFTTKHHDGFAMFDTKLSSYSSTGSECPAQRDFTRDVVDAFRAQGLWTGLYFSKPDWHNDDYWAHEWATPDRNVNYSIDAHPDRWQRFCDFTYGQIHELTHNYGPIDILWLDGGWVRPEWSIDDEVAGWLGCYRRVQDIGMGRIAAMARERNPQMLIVDRSVGGRYENYRTPEKQVPDTLLPYPWETCMTMGDSWSYVPGDNYKSVKTLIHMLCDVVAKGGNLLLNVGPDADGNLPPEAMQRMEAIGTWLQKNGHAIYATRPLYPYCEGNVRYTQSKDGRHQYATGTTTLSDILQTEREQLNYAFSHAEARAQYNMIVAEFEKLASLNMRNEK